MGLLQVGWLAVGAFFSTTFILNGLMMDAHPGTIRFAIVAILWGYATGYAGARGIQHVARVSLILNLVPAIMIAMTFWKLRGGIARFAVPQPDHFAAFTLMLQAVVGFFATAGAAGADFGMSNRNSRDVWWGGIVGIVLAVLYAAGVPLLAIAGAHGSQPGLPFTYQATIGSIGGFLASAMFLLFAAASVTPACVSSFIAGNSFSTLIPGASRMVCTMLGVTAAIVLAISGIAGNLIAVFSIVGASFGPICGAMAADYLLAGRRWAGPRGGINWAGFVAWAAGFVCGILPLTFRPEQHAWIRWTQPAAVYSVIVAFVIYVVASKLGWEAPVITQGSAASPLMVERRKNLVNVLCTERCK